MGVQKIQEFPLSTLFDKSEMIMGTESYELLDATPYQMLDARGRRRKINA